MTRPDYGIDAPGVIRNFFLFASIGLVLAIIGLAVHALPQSVASSLVWMGFCGAGAGRGDRPLAGRGPLG